MMLDMVSKFFTLYLIFPAIVLLGCYLTWKLRFVQLVKLKMSFASLFKHETGEGNVSRYQAVSSVLAGNFGTGNISGMAVALTMGGPGALVWMWIMAFLGAAIQYANCFLGVKYRQKNAKGQFMGGPMYYLSYGLGLKKIAIFFSIFVIIASFAVGGLVQVNSMTLPLTTMGFSPWIAGGVIAFGVAIVVLGGAQRIAIVCATIVPIMALFYLGSAFFILWQHADQLGSAITQVFQSAVGISSVTSGAIGFTVMKALTSGFNRAIFATDTGTGTVPLLQSGAKTEHAVIDGVVTIVAPFLVMIVCSTTALVLIVTGAYQVPDLASTNMVTYAFVQSLGVSSGTYIVLIALLLFGYSTAIVWASCLERAIVFLFGSRFIKVALWTYILFVPLGALLRVDIVWIIADIALAGMTVLNLIGIAGLSKEVIFETKKFFSREATAQLR